jgi:asparagine synthase (glutamine-hydrolysing)
MFPKSDTFTSTKAIPETSELYPKARYRRCDGTLPNLITDGLLAAQSFAKVEHIVRPLLNTPDTRHFADRIAYTSFNLWLAEDSNMRVDKMSMAMSIETRAPLEDHHLVDLAFGIPLEFKLRQGDFKRIFKDAVADIVPASILNRPKWGFAPPTSEWLRTVFKPLVDRYLSAENIAKVGYFNPQQVSKLVEAHLSKQSYEVWTLWPLLIFHIWHALYIERSLNVDHMLTPDTIMQYLF